MDITIQHLKLVNVVVKEGSITKAAAKLCLSQPALSHQLRNLEEKIDLKVFNRSNKKLILTEAGSLLFQTSEKLLAVINQLDGQLEGIKHGDKTTIRLSTECYTTYHWLPDAINIFKQAHENVNIQIVVEATKAPIQYLLDGIIDMAIVSKTLDNPLIHFEELIVDEMVVVAAKDNPLAKRKAIGLKDLKAENLFLYDIAEAHNFVLTNILKRDTTVVGSVQKVQLTEAIIQLVRANLGISIMARWALTPFMQDKDLEIIPFKSDKGSRTWYIARLNEASSIERLLISHIKSVFNALP